MFNRFSMIGVIFFGVVLGLALQLFAADAKKEPELKDVVSVLPKFAIPMREVGDRFQNMYFAAKAGNWGLAYYMSKYMNGAMTPAKITKPDEYPLWAGFYNDTISQINKAIVAKDFSTFEKKYTEAIEGCNTCHAGMGYGFIKVKKLSAPADQGIDYSLQSKAEDVPK
jgi:hypothetical protein